MEKYYPVLRDSALFSGMENGEIEKLLSCLDCNKKEYKKGELVQLAGDRVVAAGLLLEGSLIAENISYSGEEDIISAFLPGDIFGDVLMSAGGKQSPVNITASSDSTALFIPFESIMGGCENNCPLHQRLRINLLSEISAKFLALNRKIRYLSIRSLRRRIAEFLLNTASDKNSLTFETGLSRQEMAALLGANRTALSRELGRMQQSGMISFYKGSFKIEDLSALKSVL